MASYPMEPAAPDVEGGRERKDSFGDLSEGGEPPTPSPSPLPTHRRARSLNSITLMRSPAKQPSTIVTRGGASSRRARSDERGPGGSPVGRRRSFVEESRDVLRDYAEDARWSLHEYAGRCGACCRVNTETVVRVRRSLRWYGSAANLSNETMTPETFADTVAIDDKRCDLLDSSRRMNPVDLVWRLDLALTASIVPRVLSTWVARFVLGVYASAAVLKRGGAVGDKEGDGDSTVVKLSIFVSFIIVFYSNHCYTRFYRQYEAVKICCRTISDVVSTARAYSDAAIPVAEAPDDGDVDRPPAGRLPIATAEKLYRYLNAAHCAGYCALTPTYTRENLFAPFVRRHGLLSAREKRAFAAQKLSTEDASGEAFHEFVLWALAALSAAHQRGEISSPNEMVALQEMVILFRGSMQTLFDERFQEIPFAYSHLVSFVCACYLLVLAVDMGLKFGASSSITAGLFFPCLTVLFTTIVLLGLLTVGKAMSQPTGLDPEGFPIFSYIDSTALASRKILDSHRKAPPDEPDAPPPPKRRSTSNPPPKLRDGAGLA